MYRRIKLIIAILIALSSFTTIIVLANEAASPVYLPVVYNNYGANPTPTPIPILQIIGFHPSENAQEDYAVLKNNSGGPLDLTGWYLKAENQSGRYNFPESFFLNSGASVNVRSGVGPSTVTNLFIGLPFSLWTVPNNCLYVRDADGTLQDVACVGDEPTPTETPTSSVYILGFNPSSNPELDYVTIFNSTNEGFNLTGWWMKAESESGRYDFPTNFILDANSSVNVISGVGTNTATNLYVGLPYSLWTSQDNCAYLRYSDGTLLDKKCVN
jgi:hypothetical protein